jgi:LAS superfamily LD-carboxypeptidase LdcB
MAKKDKLKLGSMNFDTELDFDFDFDKIEGQVNKDMKKGRKPVMNAFKGTISGAKTAAMSPATMQKFLNAALPKEYGEVVDRTGEVTSSVSSLYNEAVREIKPSVQKITKEVDKLVPGEMKRSKAFIAKLKAILGDDSEAVRSAENGQEAMLQSKLAEVFQAQSEYAQKQHAEDKVEERLKTKVETNRFETSFGLMNSINVSLTKLSNYNEKINSAFQRKSLELQYRSFFVQQELLNSSKQFFETMKAQSEAIAKNTALPDYVKMSQSEFLKSAAREKFMSAGGKLFSNSAFIKRAMGNIKTAAKEKIGSIGSAFGAGAMGLEQVNDTRSMMADMGSMGMGGTDAYTSGGEMVGSMLPEWLASKAGKAVRDKIPKKLLDQIYKANRYTTNLEGSVNKLKDAKGLQFNMDDEMSGFGGRMKNQGREMIMNLLGLISSGGTDTKLDTGGGFQQLRRDARFDNMAHKSLTQVIPGFLSRIFRELQVIRSGNNNVQLMSFDYKSDKFSNQTSMRAGMEKSLAKSLKSSYSDYQTDKAYKLIVGDKTLSASAEKALRDKIFDASFSTKGLDADILKSTAFTQGLNKSDALEIQTIIATNLNPLSGDYHKKDMEIAHASNEARNSVNDVRGEIQALYNAGYGQMLKQMGLVTIHGDSVSINMDTYKKLARDGKLGKEFSKRVKSKNTNTGIKQPTETKAPTPKIATPEIAPVGTSQAAQRGFDFKPNRASSGGATSGEAIPLLSGIKTNTDLIIEHLDKLSKMKPGPSLSAEEMKKFFADMKENADEKLHGFGDFAREQKQKLSDRIGGLAKGNPKTLFGNIQNLAASAGALLVGTIEKVSGGIGRGAKNAKERVIDPAAQGAKNLYDKHKDTVIDVSKSLFQSGLGLVGTVFDYAKKGLADIIENKLPAGYRQLAKGLGWLKQKVKNILDEPADVYVKGRTSPALQALLMRAGVYFDQKTGKPIKNPSDINGAVVNSDGEVVLSLEDISRGIIDSTGKPFVSITKKLLNAGLGIAGKAYDAAKEAFSALTTAGASIGERIKGGLSGFKFGFNGGKQVELLTQIRDLLNVRLPGKRIKFKSDTTTGKQATQSPPETTGDTIKDKVSNVVTKTKEKLTKAIESAKEKSKDLLKTAQDKKPGLMNRLMTWKDKLLGSKDKAAETEETTEKPESKKQESKGFKFKPSMTPGVIDYKQTKEQQAKRQGNADDMLKARQERAAEIRKGHGTLKASLDPRYKSSKNVLDVMAEKAAGAFNAIKDGLSGLADIISLGGKGRKGGLIRGALRGAGALLKTPGMVGRGILAAGSMLPGAATAAKAFTIGRTAMLAGGMLLPGLGGAAAGALGIIGTALSSPVVLGAGALALGGYGIYKGFKFMTRNKISKLTRVRMMQYGIDDKNASFYHQALELEAFFESQALMFQNGQAQLNQKKLDFKQIADIFNVDSENTEELQNFATWLGERFKPVFLTHETALFAVNSKSKLADIDSLKAEQKDKYLNGITGISQVYAVKNSPFKDQEPLDVGAKQVDAAIADAREEFKGELEDKNKPKSAFSQVTKFLTHNDWLDKAEADGGIKGAMAKIAKYVPGLALGLNVFEKAVSLGAKLGKAIRPFFSGPPSALESVRFKTYGLKRMDLLKISSLRDLEDVMGKYITVAGAKANFAGNVDDIIKEVGSSFGLSAITDDNAKNWINWFHNRFLPAFLNFIGSGFGFIGKASASEMENRLTDEQRYQLALRISGTDVWNIKDTPWTDDTPVCTSNNDCADNIAFLKEKLTRKDIKEQALKVNNNLANQKLEPPPKFNVPEVKFVDPSEEPISQSNEGESPKQADQTNPESETVKSGPVPMATGQLADPSQGDQYIKLNKGVSLNGVHPEMLRNLKAMAAEYGEQTGKSININSGFRSYEKQAALYRQNPSKAAKPGTSLHEHGLALDIQSEDLNALEKLGLMRKYGFTRPVGGELWHMEPSGIQPKLDLARTDPNAVADMISDSLGKGGGGYATIAGSTLGKRNPSVAIALLSDDANTKAVTATDKDKAVATLGGQNPYKQTVAMNTTTASSSGMSGGDSMNTQTNQSEPTASVPPDTKPSESPFKSQPKAPTIMTASVANDAYSGAKSGYEGESKTLGKAFGYKESASFGNVKNTINEAAKMAGVDPKMMQSFAAVESGMNPNAKASSSSASGLFQFTGGTWKATVAKYGAKYGIDPNTSPTDARANSLMAAEYMKENMKAINKHRPNPTAGDVYAAHFLGASGANRLFRADPSAIAADLLPRAAGSNKSIFFKSDGSPRTVAELQSHLGNKIQVASKQHGVDQPTTALASATPSITESTTQGRLAMNTIVPSANDATYSQPPRTTAPSTYTAPEVIPPAPASPIQSVSLTGVPPTVPGMRPAFTPRIVERDQGFSSGKQSDSMKNMDQTLTKSLGVQSEMLTVLKQIASSMNPEQFKEAIKSITASASGGQDNSRGQSTARNQAAPEAVVSLARKVS